MKIEIIPMHESDGAPSSGQATHVVVEWQKKFSVENDRIASVCVSADMATGMDKWFHVTIAYRD